MTTSFTLSPREVLLSAQAAGAGGAMLPVCDHYSGVEKLMVKSLALQKQMIEETNVCLFDVTLDCEDGAPSGQEAQQAKLVRELALSAMSDVADAQVVAKRRVGTRFHTVHHPHFEKDAQLVLNGAADAFSFVMIPKVECTNDIEKALRVIDSAGSRNRPMPLHVLVESEFALFNALDIAAHPRVESISFGLMDFVSSHAGAIPSEAMDVAADADHQARDQFHHPLVVRAKLGIAAACHAHAKVPSHCVVREFNDEALLRRAVDRVARDFGFTRMWSIHPKQILPIIETFKPCEDEILLAAEIIEAAIKKNWAPISVNKKLHDKASYRYFWQVLELAHHTGCVLPAKIQKLIFTL